MAFGWFNVNAAEVGAVWKTLERFQLPNVSIIRKVPPNFQNKFSRQRSRLKVFITSYLVRGALACRVRAGDATLPVGGRGPVGAAGGAERAAVLEADRAAELVAPTSQTCGETASVKGENGKNEMANLRSAAGTRFRLASHRTHERVAAS